MSTRMDVYPLRYVARLTIQFKSPFFIGSGKDEIFTDEVFVADANGLPAIPGSSIAGVLKRQFEADKAKEIFGYQERNAGEGSRISISWACIHDQDNHPVEGLKQAEEIIADPVLNQALYALARDHVKINDRGTSPTGGKFDERCVTAGHRFTFEMMLEGNDNDKERWTRLLQSLVSGAVRLGGKTRRSYGVFKVMTLQERIFNLKNDDEFDNFCSHPVSLATKSTILTDNLVTYKKSTAGDVLTLEMRLTPEDFWFVGGGDGATDMTPVKTQVIKWTNNKGSVIDAYYLPGTALKGPLAHRVAYYYNGLTDAYADKGTMPTVGEENPAVRALFGYAKNKEEGQKTGEDQDGQAGRIFIDDFIFSDEDPQRHQKILNHVSIDRFTGGARTHTGGLFSETAFFKWPEMPVRITITGHKNIIDGNIIKSFKLALTDLAEGQLAIGSGAGRGNGFFQENDSPDKGKWMDRL